MMNLIRKALRIKGKILETESRHGKYPHLNFSYYGGFDLGYLRGQISILEEVMPEDEFECFLEKEKKLISSFNNSTIRKIKRDKRNEKQKRWNKEYLEYED
jgi:hypothetical protein